MADPTPTFAETMAAPTVTADLLRRWLADARAGNYVGLAPDEGQATFQLALAALSPLDRLLDLAASALSHPAALQRAREEERERCAQHFVEKAKRLGRGAAWQKTRIKGGPEVYRRHSDDDPGDDWRPDNGPAIAMRGAMADAAAIRARGPSPEPATTASAAWRAALEVGARVAERRKAPAVAKAIRALILPEEAPGHTDLMVSPESIDEFMAANPLPEESVAPAANFEMPTTYRSVPTVTTGGTMPPTPAAMPADLRPLSDWHEDMGDVLWWRAEEAPWVGRPDDAVGWPGDDYFAGWTLLPPHPLDPAARTTEPQP